jgi:hypothetical protein
MHSDTLTHICYSFNLTVSSEYQCAYYMGEATGRLYSNHYDNHASQTPGALYVERCTNPQLRSTKNRVCRT